MQEVEIKKMEIDDIRNISNILLSDFDEFWSVSTLETEFKNENTYCYIAKTNEKIIGFAALWKVIDEMHINNIVIKKDFRNMGIGTVFLEHLIKEVSLFEDVKTITLEVKQTNITAINLYKKYEFKMIGIRKNYYGINEHAIIMTKMLTK